MTDPVLRSPAPGDTGTARLTVADADTAIALGSGDVPVLGTPRVVALAEAAAVAAVEGRLDPGWTTVGVRVEVDHRRPTRVGRTVVATATVEAVDGRKLDFVVAVVEVEGDPGPDGTGDGGDDGTEVAHGRHRRVLVERSAFGG